MTTCSVQDETQIMHIAHDAIKQSGTHRHMSEVTWKVQGHSGLLHSRVTAADLQQCKLRVNFCLLFSCKIKGRQICMQILHNLILSPGFHKKVNPEI